MGATTAAGLRVLAFDPMSLDDLRESVTRFLAEDKAERERRRQFDAEWRRRAMFNGSVNMILQRAAGLFAGLEPFNSTKVQPLNGLKITLSVNFEGERGKVKNSLTFEPDDQKQKIVYKSTVYEDVLTCDMESLDDCVEGAVRTFITRLLATLSGTAQSAHERGPRVTVIDDVHF